MRLYVYPQIAHFQRAVPVEWKRLAKRRDCGLNDIRAAEGIPQGAIPMGSVGPGPDKRLLLAFFVVRLQDKLLAILAYELG